MVNGRPGVAPQTAKRTEFTRLIAEGLSIAEAVRRVGIHYRTGRRWLRGRTVHLPSGAARHYDPVIIVKTPVSARFLSEDERITIADLRRRGHTLRDIGAQLGRAPSTISRELRRNQAPRAATGRFEPNVWLWHAGSAPAAARSAATRSWPASCRTGSTSAGVPPRSALRCTA